MRASPGTRVQSRNSTRLQRERLLGTDTESLECVCVSHIQNDIDTNIMEQVDAAIPR